MNLSTKPKGNHRHKEQTCGCQMEVEGKRRLKVWGWQIVDSLVGGLLSIGSHSQTQLKQLSMHACIGEGNGNPLQCSCLANPRDRGAWWAAVYGVAQSWTRLKRLSSSSSSNRWQMQTVTFRMDKALMYSTGNYIQYPVINPHWKRIGKRMHIYNSVTLLQSRDWHDLVNQLYFNFKKA